MEVPGVVAPCGHIHERPEPKPQTFRISCHCGKNWVFTADAGGTTWTVKEAH